MIKLTELQSPEMRIYTMPIPTSMESPKKIGEMRVSAIPTKVKSALNMTHELTLTSKKRHPKMSMLIDSIRCKIPTVSTLIVLRPDIMKNGAKQEYSVEPTNNHNQSLYDSEQKASRVSCFRKNIVIQKSPTRFEEQSMEQASKTSWSIACSLTYTLFDAEKISKAITKNSHPNLLDSGVVDTSISSIAILLRGSLLSVVRR
jgi:hypothetical protein